MHPVKYFWALRAFMYKISFKHIGNLTYMGKPCFIAGRKRISIGNRTRIFPSIRMETIGLGSIEIGNNCAIEQNVHIISGGVLIIDNDVTIAANVFISNLDHSYTDVVSSVMEQENVVHDTYVGAGCFIGYGAAILPGTKLGKHCVVGANAVVRGEFPDYCVIVGCPGRVVKKYNLEKRIWEKQSGAE